jgi:tetratricopeptide (TPR) repeat protein
MTVPLKRKLWFILIGFIVLMLPLGYFVKNSIAIDMHDNAMRNAIQISPGDTNVIKESIKQIDKAIWLYSRDYIFYASKADLLCQLKKYHEAIEAYDQIFKFKPDYAEGYDSQGFIYDKLGLTDSANHCYKRAKAEQEKRISENSTDPEKVKMIRISIAYDIWLLNGQEKGHNELMKLRSEYPNDLYVAGLDSTLRKYNRQTYVHELWK